MKLSVMVISHNQAHLIRRCLESILAQKINAPWEIVISDDASTDGTWDVIGEYVGKYRECRKEREWYRPIIRGYQINSSNYNPTVTSDRCAANKANVYKHAEGEYCVNIDADDYLLGDDIYQYQIDQLEAHPECSVAVQNIWYQNDGELVENGHTWHPKNIWKENDVIEFATYCHRRAFISNPAFMMRRDVMLDPMTKYGLFFDDPIISTHHLVRGKIICSQRAQYVYVQYNNSIWHQVGSESQDMMVRPMTVLIAYLKFFPSLQKMVLEMEVFGWITSLKKMLQMKEPVTISNLTRAYVDRFQNRSLHRIIRGNRLYMKVLLKIALAISKFDRYDGVMASLWCKMITK